MKISRARPTFTISAGRLSGRAQRRPRRAGLLALLLAGCAVAAAPAAWALEPIASSADMASGVAHPDSYVVRAGQKLDDIASEITHATDKASRERVATQLFEANPRAFIGGRRDRLRVGAVLRVPPSVYAPAAASGTSQASVPFASLAAILAAFNGQASGGKPGAAIASTNVTAPSQGASSSGALPTSALHATVPAELASAVGSAGKPATSVPPAKLAAKQTAVSGVAATAMGTATTVTTANTAAAAASAASHAATPNNLPGSPSNAATLSVAPPLPVSGAAAASNVATGASSPVMADAQASAAEAAAASFAAAASAERAAAASGASAASAVHAASGSGAVSAANAASPVASAVHGAGNPAVASLQGLLALKDRILLALSHRSASATASHAPVQLELWDEILARLQNPATWYAIGGAAVALILAALAIWPRKKKELSADLDPLPNLHERAATFESSVHLAPEEDEAQTEPGMAPGETTEAHPAGDDVGGEESLAGDAAHDEAIQARPTEVAPAVASQFASQSDPDADAEHLAAPPASDPVAAESEPPLDRDFDFGAEATMHASEAEVSPVFEIMPELAPEEPARAPDDAAEAAGKAAGEDVAEEADQEADAEPGPAPQDEPEAPPAEEPIADDVASLRAAIARSPNDSGLRLRLAGLMAQRRQMVGFIDTFYDLRTLTNAEGEDWDATLALGRRLDPDNPLFQTAEERIAARERRLQEAAQAAQAASARDAAVPSGADTRLPEAFAGIDLSLPGETAADPAEPPIAQEAAQPTETLLAQGEATHEAEAEPAEPVVEPVPAPAVEAAPIESEPDPVSVSAAQPEQEPEMEPEPEAVSAVASDAPHDDPPEAISAEAGVPEDTTVHPAAMPTEPPQVAAPTPERATPTQEAGSEGRPEVRPEAPPEAPPEPAAEAAAPEDEVPAPDGLPRTTSIAGQSAAKFGVLDLDFDLDLPDLAARVPAPAQALDPVAVSRNKLELVHEYVALGDLDGARALLNEVLDASDPATREAARALWDTLA